MTLTAVLITIVVGILKIGPSCIPTKDGKWLLSKFAVHAPLKPEGTGVTQNGVLLEEEERIPLIQAFNDAVFLKRYYVFPGNEPLFLHPEGNESAYLLTRSQGNHELQVHLFLYADHIDVVKVYKKKVVAYCVSSDQLLSYFLQKDVNK